MATPHLSVRMTPEMYEETKRLAQDCRIVHAEWIRRCMYWGLMNPSQILELAMPRSVRIAAARQAIRRDVKFRAGPHPPFFYP